MPSWDAKQLFIIFQTGSQHILHNKIASESSSKKLGSNSIKADVSCSQLNVNVLLTCLTARIQEIRPAGPCSPVLQLLDVAVISSRIRPQIAAHHGHEHGGEQNARLFPASAAAHLRHHRHGNRRLRYAELIHPTLSTHR